MARQPKRQDASQSRAGAGGEPNTKETGRLGREGRPGCMGLRALPRPVLRRDDYTASSSAISRAAVAWAPASRRSSRVISARVASSSARPAVL
jgi:hypothetical protein